MAHTKAQKAVRGNRDSISKRLGVKIFGGQLAKAGNIIIRQRGMKIKAGTGVHIGRDHTLMALKDGTVQFYTRLGEKYVAVK